jgi:glycosyltransferase involved in cell wall biosynthesis
MRILSITAGAGGMYCGSCLRDNALAAELVARKHDVTLLPLYTPLLSDEPNVSRETVLFGGISVYLQQHAPIFRKLPRVVDRLLDAPWLIGAFANRSVSVDPATLGDLTVSMLEGRDGVLKKEFDKLVEWVRTEPPPDVVNITNSMLIGLAQPLRDALKRPVLCTLQGEDLFLEGLAEPYKSRALGLIRKSVADVDRFIAVSNYYSAFMSKYLHIPPARLSVVPIGINVKGFEKRESSRDNAFRVGYFARVAPEKGLHLLADAFVLLKQQLKDAPVRLEAAGYMAADQKPYFAGIRRTLERAGVAGDFSYHGTVDRDAKLAFLKELDVLSVPATYDEPKGFFLLEAMASSVPVVQPRRGSFTEIVETTGGGLLVKPDDAASLADGLLEMYQDRKKRVELGRRGSEGVRRHYTIQQSADRLLAVYDSIVKIPEGSEKAV